MQIEEKSFRKVSPTEYELVLDGRTRTIKVLFKVIEAVFQAFLAAGGVIDPETGEVQQDVLQLIASFRSVGDILLTERDEDGKVVKEGNCSNLSAEDVLALFQLATHVVENFIKLLTQAQAPRGQQPLPNQETNED